MGRTKTYPVIFGGRRGYFELPDEDVSIYLNPIERTLYRLFLSHQEGIPSDNLLQHWSELRQIYSQESRYEEKETRERALESLCSESGTVFYANVSRIKKKFVKALGSRRSSHYIIKHCPDGRYHTKAKLVFTDVAGNPSLRARHAQFAPHAVEGFYKK